MIGIYKTIIVLEAQLAKILQLIVEKKSGSYFLGLHYCRAYEGHGSVYVM